MCLFLKLFTAFAILTDTSWLRTCAEYQTYQFAILLWRCSFYLALDLRFFISFKPLLDPKFDTQRQQNTSYNIFIYHPSIRLSAIKIKRVCEKFKKIQFWLQIAKNFHFFNECGSLTFKWRHCMFPLCGTNSLWNCCNEWKGLSAFYCYSHRPHKFMGHALPSPKKICIRLKLRCERKVQFGETIHFYMLVLPSLNQNLMFNHNK